MNAGESAKFTGLVPSAPEALRYDNVGSGPGDAHRLLADWVPTGASVLDVGAGTGAFAELIRRTRGASVVCIEPDAMRAALARERGLTVEECTVEEFAARSLQRFDAIVLADVLEHLAYPAPLLLALRPLLAPSGRLLLSVPNVAHWTIRSSLLRGRFDYAPLGLMDVTHLRWFTARTLNQVLSGCGYTVEAQAGSVGEWIPQYSSQFPWTWIPGPYRFSVLRRLTKRFPGPFALQHIIRARLASNPPADASDGQPGNSGE